MKNLLYAAAFMLILGLGSCTKSIRVVNSNQTKPSIQATIQGLGNDTVLVVYHKILNLADLNEAIRDTLVARNGQFTYDLAVEEPVLLYLMPQQASVTRANGRPDVTKAKTINVLLGYGDKIEITGVLHPYYMDYEANGSEFNEYNTEVRKSYIKAVAEGIKSEQELNARITGNSNKKIVNVFFQTQKDINKVSRLAQLKFIKNNLDKELSAYYLMLQPLDTIEKYHTALVPEVREGLFQQMLDYKLNTLKKYRRIEAAKFTITAKAVAPDFSFTVLSGDLYVSSGKSKYIVPGFWINRCTPFINSLTRKNKYYMLYQSHRLSKQKEGNKKYDRNCYR